MESIPKENSFSDALTKEIKIQSDFLNKRNSQGLETGLIMSLSPEDRKDIFKAPFDKKIEMLEKKPPANIVI